MAVPKRKRSLMLRHARLSRNPISKRFSHNLRLSDKLTNKEYKYHLIKKDSSLLNIFK